MGTGTILQLNSVQRGHNLVNFFKSPSASISVLSFYQSVRTVRYRAAAHAADIFVRVFHALSTFVIVNVLLRILTEISPKKVCAASSGSENVRSDFSCV